MGMASVVRRTANGSDLYIILQGNQKAMYVWHSFKMLMPGSLILVHEIKVIFFGYNLAATSLFVTSTFTDVC